MKFELDLDDATVEALVKLKSKMVLTNETLESVAVSALKQGLGLEPFETDGDSDEEDEKTDSPSIGDLLRRIGDGNPLSGLVGVKIGRTGEVETIGGENLPEGLRDFLGGLGGILAGGNPMADDCECEKCVARRAAEKPKNFS